MLAKNLIFYISGQFGDMQDFAIKNEEWKMALLRACYVSFQNASCYFVFLIVALRLKFVRDPIRTDTKRTTRIACVAVWCIVILVNFLPIFIKDRQTDPIYTRYVHRLIVPISSK